jgi:hypothetical protein
MEGLTMAKLRILTPGFEAGDQELLASFRGLDKGRLKEETICLGLLDNTKPNAGLLLEKIGAELLATGIARDTVSIVKASAKPASEPVSPELLDRLVKETDFVITGLGN